MPAKGKTEATSGSDKPELRIGTSGYSFKDWKGTFYPEELSQQQLLPFYAEHFNTVEINFTYYRMPTQKTMAGMAAKTPEGFTFFVKAFQSFTHKGDLSGVSEFAAGIEPMREAGKLSGLLFQFPQRFKRTTANRKYLAALAEEFRGFSLAFEFRDRSWDHEDMYRSLEDHNVALVCVDEPQLSTLFPRVARATSDIGYVRFHSRDGDKWYKGAAERYDYDYSEGELRGWLPMLEVIAKRAKRLFIFFNNCHRGQAAKNAESMGRIIEQAKLW